MPELKDTDDGVLLTFENGKKGRIRGATAEQVRAAYGLPGAVQYAMADDPPPPTGGRKPLADPIRPRPLAAPKGGAAKIQGLPPGVTVEPWSEGAAPPQHPKGYFDLPSDKGPTRPAVRLGKEIYEGQHTHEDALNEMTMHAPDADLRAHKMERGVVTPSGRFIPNEEGEP